MPSSNPTVVLVHGGPLPTVSSPMSKSVDLNSDVDYVRSTLLKPLLDEGKDVVVAMHSYGGIVGGSAVQGLSKTQRTKEGKQGSVLGITAPSESLFNGFSEEQKVEYTKLSRQQSSRAFTSKVQYNAAYDPIYQNQCAYLLREDDMTIPYSVQQTIVETTGMKITKTLKAKHMVLLTMLDETAAFIIEAVGKMEDV